MIGHEKFTEILATLLQRSKKNEVHWRSETPPGKSGSADVFFVNLGSGNQIALYHWTNQQLPNRARAVIHRGGVIIAEGSAEEGDELYESLFAIYCEAKRYVTGWDKALDEIQQELNRAGVIGREHVEHFPASSDSLDAAQAASESAV